MTKVTLQTDGYKLAGNLFLPKGDLKGGFLFIQGWRGHQNLQAAQAVADLGYATLTYDMRGNGDSEGEINDFSRADFIHDATVAYDYLREQIGDDMQIGVVGSSFGGYTASMLTTKRDVSCLSFRVPANYPDNGYDTPHANYDHDAVKKWRTQPTTHSQNQALTAIHNFTGKIQIVEAGADAVVHHQTPQNYADAVADKSKLQYEVMPDAPHNLATQALADEYCDLLVTWVNLL